MTTQLGSTGSRVKQSRIKLPYTWWVGETGTRFYREIGEKKRILGIKCPQCDMVYVPPKLNCPKCFCEMHEWVPVSNTGKILTYTVIRYSVPNIQPQNPPVIVGIIKLEGADTGITHLLGEIDPDHVEIGMRVKAVFREFPQGNLLDICYFKPVDL